MSAIGSVASGGEGIVATGTDNEITNNGSIVTNFRGVELRESGHTVTNNGNITAGGGTGIEAIIGGSLILNDCSISSGANAINVGREGDTPNSVATNSAERIDHCRRRGGKFERRGRDPVQ